jgi:teichuronic acid biosynthesis glycosyltransferase TuaC
VKVLTLTNMYPTEDGHVAGAFVQEQVDSLRALGLSMDVLAIHGPRGGAKYVSALRTLRRVLADQRFDLVHAHYGLSGVVALSQRGVPVVTTFHGSDTGYVPWQRYVSWVVARLTTPIFVTQDGAARLGVTNATVIPCGVDIDRFRPIDREGARRRLGWEELRSYVLLPGSRRDPVKRADFFDLVLERARRERGDLVGVSLEQASRDQVALIMNAVDVVLMTSDSEGSPVAIKESLACGTPVVSVPVGDVPSVIEGLPGCAVAPRNPEALTQAIVAALAAGRPPELRERAKLYALNRIAPQVAAVYNRAISGR